MCEGRCSQGYIIAGGECQCICNPGYVLDEDGYSCSGEFLVLSVFKTKQLIFNRLIISECPAGYYGDNCQQNCFCGDLGNTCDRVNGSCQCNDCWEGSNCSMCKQYHLVLVTTSIKSPTDTIVVNRLFISCVLFLLLDRGDDCLETYLRAVDKVHITAVILAYVYTQSCI